MMLEAQRARAPNKACAAGHSDYKRPLSGTRRPAFAEDFAASMLNVNDMVIPQLGAGDAGDTPNHWYDASDGDGGSDDDDDDDDNNDQDDHGNHDGGTGMADYNNYASQAGPRNPLHDGLRALLDDTGGNTAHHGGGKQRPAAAQAAPVDAPKATSRSRNGRTITRTEKFSKIVYEPPPPSPRGKGKVKAKKRKAKTSAKTKKVSAAQARAAAKNATPAAHGGAGKPLASGALAARGSNKRRKKAAAPLPGFGSTAPLPPPGSGSASSRPSAELVETLYLVDEVVPQSSFIGTFAFDDHALQHNLFERYVHATPTRC